jgi:hypothetical protein
MMGIFHGPMYMTGGNWFRNRIFHGDFLEIVVMMGTFHGPMYMTGGNLPNPKDSEPVK